jgi:hypothetical protein
MTSDHRSGCSPCLAVLAILFLFVLPQLCYLGSQADVTFTVASKERVSTGSGDSLKHKYLVYTEGETFEVVDTVAFMLWNSSDRYGHLVAGKQYRSRVAGWRFPFWSTYRNILRAAPVETTAESP